MVIRFSSLVGFQWTRFSYRRNQHWLWVSLGPSCLWPLVRHATRHQQSGKFRKEGSFTLRHKAISERPHKPGPEKGPPRKGGSGGTPFLQCRKQVTSSELPGRVKSRSCLSGRTVVDAQERPADTSVKCLERRRDFPRRWPPARVISGHPRQAETR